MEIRINPYEPATFELDAQPPAFVGIGRGRSFALTFLIFSVSSLALETISLQLTSWSPISRLLERNELIIRISLILIPLSAMLAILWLATNIQWGRDLLDRPYVKGIPGIPIATGATVACICETLNQILLVRQSNVHAILSTVAATSLAVVASYVFRRLTHNKTSRPRLAETIFSLLCLISVSLGFARAISGALELQI